MNRLALVLCAASLLATPAGSAWAHPDHADFLRGDGSLRYRFYSDWELLYVGRDQTDPVDVGFLSDGTGTPSSGAGFRVVLRTDDVMANHEDFGGRAVVGFRLDEHTAVEAAFMGWGRDESRTRNIPGDDLYVFEFPDLAAGSGVIDNNFDTADVLDLDYDEDFYSGEINYRRAMSVDGADYHFNLLAGIRAMRLEEDLRLTSYEAFPLAILAAPTRPAVGTYDIVANNTMIGAQLGIETFIPLWADRVALDLYGVGGAYANQSNVRTSFWEASSQTRQRRSEVDWDPAGAFEAAVHLKVKLIRGARFAVGYRALYLVGIAESSTQFPENGSAGEFFEGLDHDGDAVFHGPSIKLSVDF